MRRRNFLKSAIAGGTAGGALASRGSAIPRRPYKDAIKLSVIGFGGMVVVGREQKDADREVAESFDRGINYFDVAPTYAKTEAETKLGIALKPYRKKVFLACKTTQRDAAGAREELEQSLKRLQTDHFDLYQFHAVTTMDDVEKILAPGGAAEAFLQAQRQGKFRYIGMSAHGAEAAIALMDRIKLDSILFPVNYVLYSQGNFGPQILEHARSKGMARMALKSLSIRRWEKGEDRKGYTKCWYLPVTEPEHVAKALRFTLSEDITAAVPPSDERIYRLALDAAAKFTPLPAAEREQLLASAKGIEPLFRA